MREIKIAIYKDFLELNFVACDSELEVYSFLNRLKNHLKYRENVSVNLNYDRVWFFSGEKSDYLYMTGKYEKSVLYQILEVIVYLADVDVSIY